MERAAQRIEKHLKQVDNGAHGCSLSLPKLGHQRSLQDLIKDNLQSRDDGSIEISNLILPTDGNAESDGAITTALSAQLPDEVHGLEHRTLLNPTNDENGSRAPIVMGSKRSDKRGHLWQRLMRRRNTYEQPKIVYSHKRRRLLAEFLMLHFIPISINFALLGLYIRQVLWAPPWPTTNILNSLQFAAKVHEILMIVSLSTILLHHIRYRLISSLDQGLPLGLVTSPFRLLDLTYLWSQEFSAAWWGQRSISRSDVISIFVHFHLFILAAVLGPATAICMLPRLGEWKVASGIADSPFYGATPGIYIGAELAHIYPPRITADLGPRNCDYGNLSQPQTNDCPRYGLEDILHAWSPTNTDNIKFWGVLDFTNITVQNNVNLALQPRTITVLSMTYLSLNDRNQSMVDVTTTSDVILNFAKLLVDSYSAMWRVVHDGFYDMASVPIISFKLYPREPQTGESLSSWKQPYVSSFCSRPRHLADESGPVSFVFSRDITMEMLGYDETMEMVGSNYTVSIDSHRLPRILENSEMGFIDVSDLESKPKLTLSAAFVYTFQSTTALCLVKAAWVDSTLSFTQEKWGHTSQALSWTWGLPEHYHTSPDRKYDWFNETNDIDIIRLDSEWLEILEYGTPKDRESDQSFFKRFSQACLSRATVDDSTANQVEKDLEITCMAYGLAMGIAEGLSKVANHFDVHALAPLDDPWGLHFPPSMTLSPWTDVSPEAMFQGIGADITYANWTMSIFSPSEIEETGTQFDFEITENVYGYGFRDVTVIMAFVVLFVYVATVFVHIIITSLGTSWSSRAWKSLGEYFVLAIQSPVPTSALDNTGGGVKNLSTWKTRVCVQELQGGKRLGFTVEEPGRPGVQDVSDRVRKVKPDWEYS